MSKDNFQNLVCMITNRFYETQEMASRVAIDNSTFWLLGWIRAQSKDQPCGFKRRERIMAKCLQAVARHK